jgi:FkbH-like protein
VESVEPTLPNDISGRLRRAEEAILEAWYAHQFDPERVERFAIAGLERVDRERLMRQHLRPLFRLLIELMRTGDPRFRAVYLDERLRYAPHQQGPVRCAEFFREVLGPDEAALLAPLVDPEAIEAVSEWWSALHARLLETPGADALRLLAVGDCLMNELRVFLPELCRTRGVPLDMRVLYFSAAVGKGLSHQSVLDFLEREPMDMLALSFLSYEGLPLYPALLRDADRLGREELQGRATALVGTLRGFVDEIRSRTDIPILLHNTGGLPLDGLRRRIPLLPAWSRGRRRALEALNEAIGELARHTPNCLLVDEAAVVAEEGPRACSKEVVPRSIAGEADFHTAEFGRLLAEPYADFIESYAALRKVKVLLVDFDNTLWEGVMADGPVRHHVEAQLLLKRLREAGILLVALSKNDPAQVRWEEMEIDRADFVLEKISWELKAKGVEEAAAELDLGLDAFALIDDRPEERQLVGDRHPQVLLLDSLDPRTWTRLARLLDFPNTRDTEEARSRTELYRARAERNEALAGEYDYATMMASLGLVARIGPARPADLDRLTELVQRTNQFNTTTVRYSRPELEVMLKSDRHRIYVADVSDRFGSLGLVGIVIVEETGDDLVFDSFVMSCRAMGFELERLLLAWILEREKGAARFVGRFVPTDRNTPASTLWESNGFLANGENEWVLDAAASLPAVPEWFEVAARD